MSGELQNKQTPMMTALMIKLGSIIRYYSDSIPARYKTLKEFFYEQSITCQNLPMDEVYHWAFSLDLMLNGLLSPKLIRTTSRSQMSDADHEDIRELNFWKRNIKFELEKIKDLCKTTEV